MYFNEIDSINISFTQNNPNIINSPTFALTGGTITGGTGAYAGATGSVTLNFSQTGNSVVSMTGTGSVTAGGKTTPLTLTNFLGTTSNVSERDYSNATLSGLVSPLGNVTGTVRFDNTENNVDSSVPSNVIVKVVLNGNDSFNLFLAKNSTTIFVSGGTGAYAGATGTFTQTGEVDGTNSFTVQGTGTIITPAAGAPIITQVKTAFGTSDIANNTWLQINGTNLAPTNTPATGVDWSAAPEFANGKMPTKLGAIDGVTVNGKPAYIYFYCSVATDPSCAGGDQINVLSPLETTTGLVQVVVTRGGVASAPFTVTKVKLSPTLPVFDLQGHVVARHLDFSLMGPATLFPGFTTPAKAGETLILVAYGLGLPNGAALTEGSATQSGSLAGPLVCRVSGVQANVAAAIISPGLYQLNVTVPAQTVSGDNPITCNYQGVFTFPGALIAVQ